MATTRHAGQPGPKPRRQQSLVEELRTRIINGRYAPRAQLPSRLELSQQLSYSSITIQRALDQLAHEGFVVSKPRAGTFVSEAPPHLHHYGLVLSRSATDPRGWERSRFAMVLHQQAMAMQDEMDTHFKFYMSVDRRPDNEAYQRLAADVRAGRLAGFIAEVPWICDGLANPNRVPAVGFNGDGQTLPNMMTLTTGPSVWLERALDYLAQRRRQRLGLVVNARGGREQVTRIIEAAQARGMRVEPRWVQGVDPSHSDWARPCVHQLMHDGQREKPDALLITDDTLADHALVGLIDAGASAPGDVEVVAHCNFPCSTLSVLPIKRLGIDVREALRIGINLINRKRSGSATPAITQLEPVFEDEQKRNASSGGIAIYSETAL